MIELSDVHKSFGTLEVIKGISATVAKGEVVCIIGPSGSGKSTILRCINGLESYDRGDIMVEGIRVDRNAPSIVAVRTRVSMVFQRFNLFPHRTALENVIEGPIYVKREPRAEATERGRALLARVGLADKADAHPPQLSGGQQQRVAIARALAMQPKAILFDEPTSALDPELVGEVLGVMRACRRGHDHGGRDPRDGVRPGGRRPRAVHRRRRDRRAGAGADPFSTSPSIRARRTSCGACCIRSRRSLPMNAPVPLRSAASMPIRPSRRLRAAARSTRTFRSRSWAAALRAFHGAASGRAGRRRGCWRRSSRAGADPATMAGRSIRASSTILIRSRPISARTSAAA